MNRPSIIPNWINGQEKPSLSGLSFDKFNPADGTLLGMVTRSDVADVQLAVSAARQAQLSWAQKPGVERGMLMHKIVLALQNHQKEMASWVAQEVGRSLKDALGETQGAIQLGLFFSGEGQRLFGRTTTSGIAHRYAMTIRQPVGVAGLIVAANTPIANVAWKVFPALISGNAVVLKAAEEAPGTAWLFGRLAHEAGIPAGLLNILQGYGIEAGAPLVEHPDVGVISFTGSRKVGQYIQQAAGKRLAKVSLELGGKNPMVICDDADLMNAVKWAIPSAFSLAGQRCASASRIIIFNSAYEDFRDLFISAVKKLKIGIRDEDDFGPLANLAALEKVSAAIEKAQDDGAKILFGGQRLTTDETHRHGFYMSPTVIEEALPSADISREELFGPVTCLYAVDDYDQALRFANDSPFGLTACIHTCNVDRALTFAQDVQSGVVMVNAGTFGSEPHMPFGGLKGSGNGSREPGPEALNVYTNIKDLYLNIRPDQC